MDKELLDLLNEARMAGANQSQLTAIVNAYRQKKNSGEVGILEKPKSFSEVLSEPYVPSTSPLPVNDPFSFDRFIPQKLDNAQEIPIVAPPITEQDKKLATKYPIVKTYNGTVVRFKTEDEAEFYEKNNGIVRQEPNVPKEAHPFNFDKFTPHDLPKAEQPIKPIVAKTHPFNFDRFIDQQSVTPLASSLEDAHKEDSKRANYVWNEFMAGWGSYISGRSELLGTTMIKLLPKAVVGSSDDEAIKQWREQISPQVESVISNAAKADITPEQEKQYSSEFFTSSVAGLSRSTSAIVMPKGERVPALFSQAYNSAVNSINSTEQGRSLPEDTKTGFGWSVGAAQTVLENTGLNLIFGKQSTRVASNLAVKTLADLVKKSDVPITAEAFDQALNVVMKDVKKQFINAGGKIGKGGIIEFATGATQETSTVLFEEIVNAATDKQIFDKTSWTDKVARILYSGAQEAVGGGILGTVSIPFSTTRNYIAEKVSTAQTPEDIVALKTELMAVAEKQNLSEPETQQLNATIDDYVRVNQKIPPDTESKKEIAEKIIEREDIENEVTKKLEEVVGVDEAFKPAIREESEALKGRAAEITDEIKNLASPTDTKLSEPIEGLDEQGIPIGNKKIFTDFDDTVWDNKTQKLTPLGEELKAKIAAGEDVEVLTKRENTDENIDFIAGALGIKDEDKSKMIKAGLQAEEKGAIVDRETGDKIYYNENQEELDAAKTGEKVNVAPLIEKVAPFINDIKGELNKNIFKGDVNKALEYVSAQWHDEGTRATTENTFPKEIVDLAKEKFPQETQKSLSVASQGTVPLKIDDLKNVKLKMFDENGKPQKYKIIQFNDFNGTREMSAQKAKREMENRHDVLTKFVNCLT